MEKSWLAPHLVCFKNTSRFYGRTSAGKYQLDVNQIRDGFLRTSEVPRRLEDFRTGCIGAVLGGETPIPLEGKGVLLLHLQPFSSVSGLPIVDPKEAKRAALGHLQPLCGGGWNSRYNFDGLVTHSPIQAGAALSYIQVFRSGALESVESSIVLLNPSGANLLRISKQAVLDHLRNLLQAAEQLFIAPPLLLSLSLLDVRGACFDADTFRYNVAPQPIERNHLVAPSVVIDNYGADPDTLLQPTFDALWQASGFPGWIAP